MGEQKIVNAADMRWLVRKGTDDHLGPSNHESGLEAVMLGLMPDGGTFLDIGSHVGHWTLRLATKADHVIAFEPNPDTLFALGVNVGLNGLDNVEIHPLVMGEEDGWTWLRDPHTRGVRAGGSLTTLEIEDAPLIAYARRGSLDELDIPQAHLVKMDVEGAEAEVLRGGRETLKRCQPNLVIEMHHRVYPEAGIEEAVHAVLAEIDYRHYTVMSLGESVYWVAVPQE